MLEYPFPYNLGFFVAPDPDYLQLQLHNLIGLARFLSISDPLQTLQHLPFPCNLGQNLANGATIDLFLCQGGYFDHT